MPDQTTNDMEIIVYDHRVDGVTREVVYATAYDSMEAARQLTHCRNRHPGGNARRKWAVS